MNVAFRLTVYESNGTTPELEFTSIRTGTNPYIVSVPSGDGQEVDLLTGAVRSGAYNVEVADVVTGTNLTGTVRIITNKLEDGQFRQQLLSRRAKIECSRNGGSTWAVWTNGYLTSLRQTTAITYQFTVSDSRRLEATHTAFTWWSDTTKTTDERREFPNRGCIVGGPLVNNFGPFRASGGWEFAWKEVQSGYLALAFTAAYEAPSYARSPYFNVSTFLSATRNFLEQLPPISTLTGSNFTQLRDRQFVYAYPKLLAMVTDGANTWYGSVRAAFTPVTFSQSGQGGLTNGFDISLSNYVYVQLDAGQSTSYPAANTRVRVRLLQRDVSDINPIYINEHPVDIAVKLYKTIGVPYNSASVASTRSAVGTDVRCALRITQPMLLGKFLAESIFGPFGFSARTNLLGEQEFFPTRIANATAPTITIAGADIVGDTPPPVFDLDEGTVVTSFRLTARSLTPFVPDPNSQATPPADGVLSTEFTEIIQNTDTSTYSTREVAYKIPGLVHDGSVSAAGFVLSPEVVGNFYRGIVAEGFDRFGRGAIATEVQVLADSTAASLQVGDEVVLNIPYYPNQNYRIGESNVGTRIAQIVRRTEMPEGPIFKLIDSGVNQQPTPPSFTLAQFAGDTRRVAQVTVDNAVALNAGDITLAVQYTVDTVMPTRSGTLFTRFRPGTIPTLPFLLPYVPPGSRVWVRMRSEKTELRASAWTDWEDIQLAAWTPPSSLTASLISANSVTLTIGLGSPANTLDGLDVFVYQGASAPLNWGSYRLASLSSNSTSTVVRDLEPSTQYTFGVAFKDVTTGAYSTFATTTVTTAALNTITCPAAPKMKLITAFPDAGSSTGVVIALGGIDGYNIVVERANDSGGSPGTWTEIAVLTPLSGYFVDVLPSDFQLRWYRVFYRLSGFLDGAPGTPRSSTPYAIPDDLVLGEGPSIIAGPSIPWSDLIDIPANVTSLVDVVWGTPSAESGNAIEVQGTIRDLNDNVFTTSPVYVTVVVSDAANDGEPSNTATISAATVPVGSVVAGSGSATAVFKTNGTGQFKIRVSETAVGSRYIWVKAGGHEQVYVRARDGILQLTYS